MEVGRFGLVVRRQASKLWDLGSISLQMSSLWTLSCDFVHHS